MPNQPIYSFPRQLVTKLTPKQIGMFHVKHLKTLTPDSGTVSRETQDLPSPTDPAIPQPFRRIHLKATRSSQSRRHERLLAQRREQ